ncbi:MAG: hypothetical protein VB055_00115 [Oscillospiraceae bacterium]|nr:hypothetical protein [Oscillospiraceae bacterium]
MKKTLCILLVLLLTLSLLAGCGAKSTLTFQVTYEDGTTKDFSISTEKETLSDALVTAGLVSQEEADANFITTVDGVTTDYNANQSWWRLVDKDGNDASVGVTEIKTADADGYGFIYTVG